MTESVYSSATVLPDSLYAVYAAVGGIVDEVKMEEGDLVMRGEELVNIINNTPALNIENAKLALELAKSKYQGKTALLIELGNEISSARLKMQNDSIRFYRQQRLWDQNIGTRNELENTKLAYEVAQNNLMTLLNKLERTKNDLETQLQQAENNYQTSKIINEDYTVNSKMNGRVYEVFINPGERVSGQQPLAHVGSKNRFIIEMMVDEVDITKVRIGQKALVVLDAFGEQVFEATVCKIAPGIDDRSGTFTIEGVFDNQPEVLYSGLSGEANIIVGRKSAVMAIPLSYLMEGNQVKTESGVVEVKAGLKNLDYVEIISGLDTNAILVKPE